MVSDQVHAIAAAAAERAHPGHATMPLLIQFTHGAQGMHLPPQSARAQATIPLLKEAKRAILLTGTPALSRPIEILTLMQVCMCRG